ncbi:MAG: histidine kinase [Acidobacteriota bacterium]
MQQPQLTKRRLMVWSAVFAAYTLLNIFSASRIYVSYSYGNYSISWRRALLLALPDWYVWALLTPSIYFLARRFPIERPVRGRALMIHIPASLLLSVLKMIIEYNAIQIIDPNPNRQFPALQIQSTLLTYWSITGIIFAFDYYAKYRQHQLKSSQLETRLAQAQLQALRAQLHPHFLFNTLHAVSALMHRDVEAADRMIARLSDLLRLALENTGAQEVSLKQEMEFLHRYLEIEQIRFQDRLTVNIDIEAEALDASVPNLLLQPLVENAIRHGIAPRAAAGRLEITARRRDRRLRVEVRDDGAGLDRNGFREGIGIANTRARLEQLYGADHRFEMGNRESGGMTVSIEIPFRLSSEAKDGRD